MEEGQQNGTDLRVDKVPVLGFIFLTITLVATLILRVPGGGLVDADKQIIIASGVLLALISALIVNMRRGGRLIPRTPIVYASGLLLVSAILSTIFAISTDVAFAGLGFETGTLTSLIISVVVLLLASSFYQSKGRGILTIMMLYLCYFLLFFVQVLHLIFGWTFGLMGTAPTSNLLGSWHDFGIFAGLITLLAIITLDILPSNSAQRALTLGAFVTGLLGIMLVNYSLVFWVLGIAAVLFLAKHIIHKRKSVDAEVAGEPTRKSFPVASTIIIAVSLLLVIFGQGDRFMSRGINAIAPAPLEVRPSIGGTREIIGSVWGDDALLGVGMNQFSRTWNLNKPLVVNQSVFWNIDFNQGFSYFLTAFATQGILGGLVWIIFYATLLVSGFRSLRKPIPHTGTKALMIMSFLASLYLWSFHLLYIPGPTVVFLTYLFTGIYLSTVLVQKVEDSQPVGRRGLAVALTAILLIGSITVGYTYLNKYRAVSAYSKSRSLTANPAEALALVDRSVALDGSAFYIREQANLELSVLAEQLVGQDMTDEAVLEKFMVDYQGVIDTAQAAIDADPSDYQNYLRMGDVYEAVVTLGVSGSDALARNAYLEAARLNPTSPNIPFRLARLEAVVGNVEEAKNYVDISLNIKPNYNPAYMLASQIALSEGDVDLAIRSTELGAASSPEDIGAFFQLGYLYLQNGSLAEAVAALERAVILRPDYSNAKYFLGIAYEAAGRPDLAIAQFEDVLLLNPGNQEVISILENLRGGFGPFGGPPSGAPAEPIPVTEPADTEG